MELLLTDEQRLLQDSISKMLAQAGGVKRARALRAKFGGFDREMHARMGAEGLFGILVPAEHGGLELGLTEVALLMMEAGRALAPEPIAETIVAAHVLASATGTPLLDEVVAGQRIVVPVFADSRVGACPASTVTGDRLEGAMAQAPHAAVADSFLIEAATPQGPALHLIERGGAGIEVTSAATVDGRERGHLLLRGVQVRPVSDEQGVEAAYDLALFCAAAELVGVMSAALDMTVEYLKTRKQFGKLIGSFQALQHRAADDLARLVSARSFVFQVAGQGLPLPSAMASALKAHCGDKALEVTKSAIQMHGAIGFTDEHDIGLYLKRAMWLSTWLGNAAVHRRRYMAMQG